MKRSASFLAGLISIALFTLFALVGCNQTELQRIAQLESRLDSLRVQSAQKDATINEFFQSIDEIEANLNLIRSKEQQINAEVRNKQEGELPEDGRERIAKDIIDINRIMSENHSKMEVLSKKLGRQPRLGQPRPDGASRRATRPAHDRVVCLWHEERAH